MNVDGIGHDGLLNCFAVEPVDLGNSGSGRESGGLAVKNVTADDLDGCPVVFVQLNACPLGSSDHGKSGDRTDGIGAWILVRVDLGDHLSPDGAYDRRIIQYTSGDVGQRS